MTPENSWSLSITRFRAGSSGDRNDDNRETGESATHTNRTLSTESVAHLLLGRPRATRLTLPTSRM